jgi:hypothetical protein
MVGWWQISESATIPKANWHRSVTTPSFSSPKEVSLLLSAALICGLCV